MYPDGVPGRVEVMSFLSLFLSGDDLGFQKSDNFGPCGTSGPGATGFGANGLWGAEI